MIIHYWYIHHSFYWRLQILLYFGLYLLLFFLFYLLLRFISCLFLQSLFLLYCQLLFIPLIKYFDWFIFLIDIFVIPYLPVVFLLLRQYMHTFFLSFHKHSCALEQIIYEQIANLPFKNVARLLNVHAHVNGRPIIHIFGNVVDSLWKSGWAIRSLQKLSHWRKKKD